MDAQLIERGPRIAQCIWRAHQGRGERVSSGGRVRNAAPTHGPEHCCGWVTIALKGCLAACPRHAQSADALARHRRSNAAKAGYVPLGIGEANVLGVMLASTCALPNARIFTGHLIKTNLCYIKPVAIDTPRQRGRGTCIHANILLSPIDIILRSHPSSRSTTHIKKHFGKGYRTVSSFASRSVFFLTAAQRR